MIRFLKGLVLVPVALVVILLAVANRAPVVLSLDPVNPQAPVFSLTLPLYAILFGAVALGIVVGGVFTWLGQGEVRSVSRGRRREIRRLEGETTRLRAYAPDEGVRRPGPAPSGPGRAALPAPR